MREWLLSVTLCWGICYCGRHGEVILKTSVESFCYDFSNCFFLCGSRISIRFSFDGLLLFPPTLVRILGAPRPLDHLQDSVLPSWPVVL